MPILRARAPTQNLKNSGKSETVAVVSLKDVKLCIKMCSLFARPHSEAFLARWPWKMKSCHKISVNISRPALRYSRGRRVAHSLGKRVEISDSSVYPRAAKFSTPSHCERSTVPMCIVGISRASVRSLAPLRHPYPTYRGHLCAGGITFKFKTANKGCAFPLRKTCISISCN